MRVHGARAAARARRLRARGHARPAPLLHVRRYPDTLICRGMAAAAAACLLSVGVAPIRKVLPTPSPSASAGSVYAGSVAPFGPSSGCVAQAFRMDDRFKAWPALNSHPAAVSAIGVARRKRMQLGTGPHALALEELLQGDSLEAKLGRALAARKALDRKEFFETFEFFAQVRSSIRAESGTLIDVAGGHGLLATLFAVFERRRFSRVLVADTRRPSSFSRVAEAAREVAPWAEVEYVEGEAADMLKGDGGDLVPPRSALVCVHGCGALTDACVSIAAAAPCDTLAVMPCCYGNMGATAPPALRKALGVALAADVERTHALEASGFDVAWKAVPAVITPLNRVIVGRRRRPRAGTASPPPVQPIACSSGLEPAS